jgi:hypothetical protein
MVDVLGESVVALECVYILSCRYLFRNVANSCSVVQMAQHCQRWEVNDLRHFTCADDTHAKFVLGHYD